MRLWNKDESNKTEVPSRITKMSTQDLTNWMETSIMGLGASFDNWRYHGGYIKSVTEHLDVLGAMWAELQNRTEADKL